MLVNDRSSIFCLVSAVMSAVKVEVLFVMTVSDLFTNKCVVITCQLVIGVSAVPASWDYRFPEIPFFLQ